MIARVETSIKIDPIAWDSVLPFEIKKPSENLLKSIKEIEAREVVKYNTKNPIAEMMKDLKS